MECIREHCMLQIEFSEVLFGKMLPHQLGPTMSTQRNTLMMNLGSQSQLREKPKIELGAGLSA
eukprot:12887588-Prorocentrum_lima.AAC.1